MSSHFRSPFKPKTRTPIIVTTPAPQFILTSDPPSTSTLAPNSSSAYLRPPQQTYQAPVVPAPRPRSATFRSSPLAGSVVSSDSFHSSQSEDAMEDEKKIRRIQSMRERTGNGRENERDGVGRPMPTRVASTSELSTRSRLRFSDTFETREKLLARPAYAHLASRRPLSELSILRPIGNTCTEEPKEPPPRRAAATAPMSAEGMWRSSAEVPVFSRKLLKAQNVVMPVKAPGPGPSRLRKHPSVASASPRTVGGIEQRDAHSGGSSGVSRSKSESNLSAARRASAAVGIHLPAKLTRFRRSPSSNSSLIATESTSSRPSDGTSGGSSTTRKLKKLRAAISIPQIIREEERNDECPSQPEVVSELPPSSVFVSDPRPAEKTIPSSRVKSTISDDQGEDDSLTAQGVSSLDSIPSKDTSDNSLPPQLPEIETASRVFSWFSPRTPESRTTPSSPTLTTLLNTLVHTEAPSGADSAPESPHGSVTESLSEFEYSTSMSGQSTPCTAPGTPCMSAKTSLSSLRDLIAQIDAAEIGKAISFYTSDDSDTKTAQGASVQDTLSNGSTIKEQHFIDVPPSEPQSKAETEKDVKLEGSRLNLRRCTRLFPHPRPHPHSVSPVSPDMPQSTSPVKVVKRRPSFFERMIPCVKRPTTPLPSESSEKSE